MIKDHPTQQFTSLSEIRTYKEGLLKDIHDDENKITSLWGSLLQKPKPNEIMTPTKRFSNVVNVGAGVMDGLILGWKLYRKYKGTTSFFKSKKR